MLYIYKNICACLYPSTYLPINFSNHTHPSILHLAIQKSLNLSSWSTSLSKHVCLGLSASFICDILFPSKVCLSVDVAVYLVPCYQTSYLSVPHCLPTFSTDLFTWVYLSILPAACLSLSLVFLYILFVCLSSTYQTVEKQYSYNTTCVICMCIRIDRQTHIILVQTALLNGKGIQ